jgi:hypothetical protein
MSLANGHAPTLPAVVVAFYTIGDGSPASGDSANTVSGIFQERAQMLAPTYAFGVNTVSQGTAKIKALDPGLPISKVYFFGHGNKTWFFFSGESAPPPDEFRTNGYNELLMNPTIRPNVLAGETDDGTSSGELLTELANHFIVGSASEIDFLCCECGLGLVGEVAQFLSGKGITGTVNGYNYDYRTDYLAAPPRRNPPANWAGPGWYDIIQVHDATKRFIKRGGRNSPPAYDTTTAISP